MTVKELQAALEKYGDHAQVMIRLPRGLYFVITHIHKDVDDDIILNVRDIGT